MANKTQMTDTNVEDFINQIEDEQKRKDSLELLEIFKKTTKEEPKMWGTSIVGFGCYHYKSDRSTAEGDWPITGFSQRKSNLTVYIMPGFDYYQDQLAKIGKHKTGRSCLYIRKLADIDLQILQEIIKDSVKVMKTRYATK